MWLCTKRHDHVVSNADSSEDVVQHAVRVGGNTALKQSLILRLPRAEGYGMKELRPLVLRGRPRALDPNRQVIRNPEPVRECHCSVRIVGHVDAKERDLALSGRCYLLKCRHLIDTRC